MIQRRQTLYLILGLFFTVAALCLPVGVIVSTELGHNGLLTNLWLRDGDGFFDFRYCPPFIILLLTCPVVILTIFLYKQRKAQMILCGALIVCVILWYACLAVIVFVYLPINSSFEPNIVANALPLCSLISYWLAYRGVRADERLIRSMDRLR